ncbi:nucleoside hydrolase [Vibrio owensii]|uniref:nucleoside hydrolase n=1 Tax=Vibrio owensii TaxID=696485 RepID=UPI003CC5C909
MKTPIWLDLELREDIDDILTLIYALERNANVRAISINNPSTNELRLLNGVLRLFGAKIPFFMTGVVTEYPANKDVTASLSPYMSETPIEATPLSIEFVKGLGGPLTVFCGGSLTTLSELITLKPDVDAVIQGGFASYKLVPETALLKKFKGRDKVPTWNLNLDLKATEEVLASGIPMLFVSKNICHSAFVSPKDLAPNSMLATVLANSLEGTKYKDKCLHDVLAFMAIENPEIFSFKPVELLRTDDERVKWWSESREDSNYSISVDYDKNTFLELLKSRP